MNLKGKTITTFKDRVSRQGNYNCVMNSNQVWDYGWVFLYKQPNRNLGRPQRKIIIPIKRIGNEIQNPKGY